MRNRLVALIMVVIILLCTIYVYLGNNWLADKQFLQKKKNNLFVKNELMQNLIEIEKQSQKILDQIFQLSYKIEIFPDKNIILKEETFAEFDKVITVKPQFDHHNFYLVFENTLIAYNKKNRFEVWQKQFTEKIIEVVLLDVNRILVVLESNEIICASRESGSEMWSRKNIDTRSVCSKSNAFQISLDAYKQLDNSVILSIEKNRLLIFNNISGKNIYEYNSIQEIDFVSDFDLLEKSIYVVKRNELWKLEFEINLPSRKILGQKS